MDAALAVHRATPLCVLESPDDLSRLRRALRRHAAGFPASAARVADQMLDDILLAACELATNGLRHGRPPVHVRLVHTGEHLILDVTDNDPDTTPVYAAGRSPGDGGLGLPLVRSVAAELGWYTADGLKHVWARFPHS